MPLRATLNDKQVQSFEFLLDEWEKLKHGYRQQKLLMPCCLNKAIPKTSKLGTQYFAHSRRGDCTSAPESQDHLYLKFAVAKVAQEAGWTVTTEYQGCTPSGEQWIADVFCEKGTAKIAFEIQWSQQAKNEYLRRTEKYTQSGVRCAWLFRLNGSKEYGRHEFIESYSLPYFGFKKKNDDYVVSRYQKSITEFVQGMLSGKLTWGPKAGDLLNLRVCYIDENCWRCKRTTNLVTGLEVLDKNNHHLDFLSFGGGGVEEWINSHIDNTELHAAGIGLIKNRYSKTVGYSYMSNGCFHCDALQGNFFLPPSLEGGNKLVREWPYNPEELYIEPTWSFEGNSGAYRF